MHRFDLKWAKIIITIAAACRNLMFVVWYLKRVNGPHSYDVQWYFRWWQRWETDVYSPLRKATTIALEIKMTLMMNRWWSPSQLLQKINEIWRLMFEEDQGFELQQPSWSHYLVNPLHHEEDINNLMKSTHPKNTFKDYLYFYLNEGESSEW